MKNKQCEYDIVIFGASGFTGKYILAELTRAFMADPCLTFAVAGRNVQKLHEALLEVQDKHATGHMTLSKIKKIVANVDNPSSLLQMAQQARVVINCVGPYAFYGEQVVKACIKGSCHHIDVSGETLFLDAMQLKHDVEARQAGVYIVGSCGFDSVPSDMGVLFTVDNFKGDLNSIEGFFTMTSSVSGASANYGTFASAVNSFRDRAKIRAQHKRLLQKPIPLSNHPLESHNAYYAQDVGYWCHNFPGCDRAVVKRSQHYFYHNERKRPIQYAVYFCQESLIHLCLTILSFMFFVIMCSFRATRWLMLLFPDFLTCGMFSRKGPSHDKIKNTSFSLTLIGRGYNTKIYEADVPHDDKPSQKLVTKVSGPDAGYITTPICAVSCALCLLQEPDKLPPQGGVFTPAVAFAKTSLIQRLQKRGITFKVIDEQKESLIKAD